MSQSLLQLIISRLQTTIHIIHTMDSTDILIEVIHIGIVIIIVRQRGTIILIIMALLIVMVMVMFIIRTCTMVTTCITMLIRHTTIPDHLLVHIIQEEVSLHLVADVHRLEHHRVRVL